MGLTKRLALIAVGYALAIAGAIAAVTINELLMPAEISQGSSGMVAFGDMILFVLVAGFLGLVPTWFLLKLLAEKFPRLLLTGLLVMAGLAPICWVLVAQMSSAPTPDHAPSQMLGLVIALVAIPRIVAGPVVVLIEGAACFFLRTSGARLLLAGAAMLDLIPMALFAVHMVRATA
jgi:hypothetical protein